MQRFSNRPVAIPATFSGRAAASLQEEKQPGKAGHRGTVERCPVVNLTSRPRAIIVAQGCNCRSERPTLRWAQAVPLARRSPTSLSARPLIASAVHVPWPGQSVLHRGSSELPYRSQSCGTSYAWRKRKRSSPADPQISHGRCFHGESKRRRSVLAPLWKIQAAYSHTLPKDRRHASFWWQKRGATLWKILAVHIYSHGSSARIILGISLRHWIMQAAPVPREGRRRNIPVLGHHRRLHAGGFSWRARRGSAILFTGRPARVILGISLRHWIMPAEPVPREGRRRNIPLLGHNQRLHTGGFSWRARRAAARILQ